MIEVTGDGQVVREYNNVINETYNALVTYAQHLPPDFFETMPSCANG